jgi:hypothetical protein
MCVNDFYKIYAVLKANNAGTQKGWIGNWENKGIETLSLYIGGIQH